MSTYYVPHSIVEIVYNGEQNWCGIYNAVNNPYMSMTHNHK